MSKRRGTQHLRRRRYASRAHDDRVYGIVPSLAETIDDLPEAKRKARARLVRIMGADRAGPVEYEVIAPGPRVVETIEEMDDTGQYEIGGYRKFVAEHPEAWLVLASAPRRQPRG